MDDLANDFGISKKTIYQHFKDKDDLVYQVADTRMNNEEIDLEKIREESVDAIEEIYKVSVYIKQLIANMNPSLLYDLKKFYPAAWKRYQEHKVRCMHHTIADNIVEGKKSGHYRQEVDAEIMSSFRIASIELSFDNNIFPRDKFDFFAVQMQLFDHFLMGIITPTGLELFKKYKTHYEK